MSDFAISEIGRARRDPSLAVLEGFHAIKHAVRFGAEFLGCWTDDADAIEALRSELAPDVTMTPTVIDQAALQAAAPRVPIVAVAARPHQPDPNSLIADPSAGLIVLLEQPRRLSNVGACVRVAAACSVKALFATGPHDPWHADALRGSAGLHFALPVWRVRRPPIGKDRQLVAIDPQGEPLRPEVIDPRSVLAFGTERQGLSPELLESADRRASLPMAAGVSSINLATAVSATLFLIVHAQGSRRPVG